MTGASQVRVRRARPSETDQVVETLSLAFHADPVWSWAFPDDALRHRQFQRFFSLLVHSTFEVGEVWVTDNVEAVGNWIPPGGPEFAEADEEKLPGLLAELVGASQADLVVAAFDRFDQHRPAEPHWYLDFLGTHPNHAGKGLGMGLLSAMLVTFDEAGSPAYLESSNPANNVRYTRLGYRPLDVFEIVDGGPVATTMWRDPAPACDPEFNRSVGC